MDSTPVTLGLVGIAALGGSISVGFLLWLWKQFKEMRGDIVGMIREHKEEVGNRVAGLSGQVQLLSERCHFLELHLAEDRAKVAETYMTKQSAGVSIDRLSGEVNDLRKEMSTRFSGIEQFLRGRN